jgi:hypothetical protein
MKLHPLTIAVLLFSPAIAAHCRLGRTLSRITKTRSAITKSLSASTKKPASVAGFLYLRLSSTRLSAPFLPATRLPLRPRAQKLIIQTPSSRYPPA